MKASELKEILDQHQLWIESNGVQGKCADLEDARLDGANLINADLEGAILCIADLTGANLSGANLSGANLYGANLSGANLEFATLHGANLTYANLGYANLIGANLIGASLEGANLYGAVGLPNVSWIIPGCLVQLNENMHGFYLKKENKLVNFAQDSFGFFIQDNREEKTFDMLVEDRIIRNIPHWVKYSGLKQIASESV
jgi:hypothetical protein